MTRTGDHTRHEEPGLVGNPHALGEYADSLERAQVTLDVDTAEDLRHLPKRGEGKED